MNSSKQGGRSTDNSLPLDFDFHGIVGLRIVNATPKDAASFVHRFEYYQQSLDREADITVRFVDDPSPPSMIYLGLNSAAFTETSFYLLDKKDGYPFVKVPMESIGSQCEIEIRRGSGVIDLLYDILKLTFLSKGCFPTHASAFQYNGIGILVVGWKKGGKTESLLSFVNQGAMYVGDEIVILSTDGKTMFGLPIGVTLWDWQFKYIPELMPRIDWERKILMNGVHLLEGIERRTDGGMWKRIFPSTTLTRAIPYLRRGLKISHLPESLFKDQVFHGRVPVDKLFLIMSHSEATISVTRCQTSEVVARIISMSEFEMTDFLQMYRSFRFAFPNVRNEFLDKIIETQNNLIRSILENKEAYKVLHPYPVPLDQLFEHMQPYCVSSSHQSVSL